MNNIGKEAFSTDLDLEINREIEGRYLTFWIDSQLFGIPISEVVQIVGVQPITAIPDYPYYAKGIINLRGSIIPVIDVRLRLGREERAYSDRTCIIVINSRNRVYGLVVDEVEEVADMDESNISTPPQMSDSSGTDQYLTGIGRQEEGVLLLLDAFRLVGNTWDELDYPGEA